MLPGAATKSLSQHGSCTGYADSSGVGQLNTKVSVDSVPGEDPLAWSMAPQMRVPPSWPSHFPMALTLGPTLNGEDLDVSFGETQSTPKFTTITNDAVCFLLSFQQVCSVPSQGQGG